MTYTGQGSCERKDHGQKTKGTEVVHGNPLYQYAFARKTQSPLVEISLGCSGNVLYSIHKDMLVETSDYFKKSLNSGMKESKDLKVNLDDLGDEGSRAAFDQFVEFVYKGTYEVIGGIRIDDPIPMDSDEAKALAQRCGNELMLHVRVNVLAERLQCKGLLSYSMEFISDLLLVSRQYTSPTLLEDAIARNYLPDEVVSSDPGLVAVNYGWNEEWQPWVNATDYDQYRKFCLNHNDLRTGDKARFTTILEGDDVFGFLRLAYEGTPHRSGPEAESSLREVLLNYVVPFFGKFRGSEAFMNLVFENRELFDDLMKRIRIIPKRG